MNWQATITKKQYDDDIERARRQGQAEGMDRLYKDLAALIRDPESHHRIVCQIGSDIDRESSFVLQKINTWADFENLRKRK